MSRRFQTQSLRYYWMRIPLHTFVAITAVSTACGSLTMAQQAVQQPETQPQVQPAPPQQPPQLPQGVQQPAGQNRQTQAQQPNQQLDRTQQQGQPQANQRQRSQTPPERQTNKLPEERADQDAPALGVITGPCPGRAVCVKATMPNSPADEAGIEPGDYILAVEGQEVTSPAALKKVISESKSDSEVTLRVWRQGEEMDRKVYLASMSDKLPKGHDAWLGVMLAAAEEGVKIDHVVPGSPAESSDLEEGDVIKQVKGESITEASTFIEKIESMGPDEELKLVVVRDGEEKEVSVTLGSMSDAPIAFLRQLQSGSDSSFMGGQQGMDSSAQMIDRALDDMRRQIRELRKEVRELKGDDDKQQVTREQNAEEPARRAQPKPDDEKKGDTSSLNANADRVKYVSQIQLRLGPQGNFNRSRYYGNYGNYGGYRSYNYYPGGSRYYNDGYRTYRPNYSNNYYYRYGGRPYYYGGNSSWYGYRPQPGIQIAPNVGVYWY